MSIQQDIVIAGVGGQGLLTIANLIGGAALKRGLNIKQSEVHGMAQRGGSVVSHLRLSEKPIASDIIPEGTASLLIATEPMEALRYLPWLKADAWLISNRNPVQNTAKYPSVEALHRRIQEWPRHILLDADALAQEADARRAANVVILGMASFVLSFSPDELREQIRVMFDRKGPSIVEKNINAFDLGISAAEAQKKER